MKYFFSSPFKALLEIGSRLGIENYLISFAREKDYAEKPEIKTKKVVLVDSGAFTVWNSGSEIDIDQYLNFCKTMPPDWVFVNLDVIPKTGSRRLEIDRCIEASYENFVYLSKSLKNVMPVFHYGEKIDVLKKYEEACDYIGVSPANDTSEKTKRKFLDHVFFKWDKKKKYHGLGYSSATGLLRYPFYSVDSISYKRGIIKLENSSKSWIFQSKKFHGLLKRNVEKYLKMERDLTKIWEARGVKW